jgi:hypothetical protein
MNPMKWMRKNKTRIMAIVVVLLMIAFVGGYGLQRLMQPGIKGSEPVGHYYNKKGAISNDDIRSAQGQLALLKALGADAILQSRPTFMQTADIPSLALAQVLFAESRISPLIGQEIKRIARQQQLRLADWQVDEFFRELSREKPEILWLLLRAEARQAGYVISSEDAGGMLKVIIPQLYARRGATPEQTPTAEQVITSIMDRHGVDQETILRTFADLLGIMQYANLVTQEEDVTIAQLKYDTLQQSQSMDIEAVLFDAAALTGKAAQPTAEAMEKQFDKYKMYAPFDVNSENPYGFGYRQPPRVRLEWMLVELSDVTKQVPVPTAEQTEEYYQRNQSQFMKEVPSDPNDPNSPKIEKPQSYADVAAQISKQLLESRVSDRADNIISAAREITDANLAAANLENLTSEQMRKLAGDYKAAAADVGKKFGLTVYNGKTGFVSPRDIASNDVLGRLFMEGQDKAGTPLVTIVFAVEELNASRLGPFAPAKPRMYESIGPIRDVMQKVVGLVRITGAEKAAEPCSIDLTYAKKLPVMKDGKPAESNGVYAVRDAVSEDIKKLEALPLAKEAAQALMADVPSQGWDKALAAVNKKYGVAPADGNKADTFKMEPIQGLRRISEQDVRIMLLKAAHDPLQTSYVKRYTLQKELVDKFYSLLEPDKTIATNVPLLMEFKPEMIYYVVKSMSRNAVDPNTYQQTKDRIALMNDYISGQSLGFEHFRPDNVIRRMGFQWDEKARNMQIRQELPPQDDVL